jgi:hypothetical protein
MRHSLKSTEDQARELYALVRSDPRRTAKYYADKLGLDETKVELMLDEFVRLGELGVGTPGESNAPESDRLPN